MSGFFLENEAGPDVGENVRFAPFTPATTQEILSAGFERQALVDTISANLRAQRRAYGEQDQLFETLIGKSIDDIRAEFESAGGQFYRLQVGDHERSSGEANRYDRLAEFVRGQLPADKQGQVLTSEQVAARARDISLDAEARAQEVYGRTEGIGGLLSIFAGEVAGSFSDPINLGLLGIGAPARVGLAARIGIEAAIGASTEAILQPTIQNYRSSLGLEHGFAQAAQNVLYAGAGAAAITAGIGAIGKGVRAGLDRLPRNRASEAANAPDGIPQPGGQLSDDTNALADVVRRINEIEDQSPFEAGSAGAREHAARLDQVEGAIEGGQPLPDLAPRGSGPGYRAMSSEDLATHDIFAFDPSDIEVDAKLMQFKSGGDEFGVTERLQGVAEWDPFKAGILLSYEFADGRRVIADGHQRLGLARRLQEQGQSVEVLSRTLREIDGVTPEEARMVAALRNIAEGTGSPVDAAKVLKIDPARVAELPPRSALVRVSRDLVNLSDDAFMMVVNERVRPEYAALVGRLAKDMGDMHLTLLDLLERANPRNLTEAEALVRQGRELGVVRETQTNLFGTEEITSNLVLERARVLSTSISRLKKDRAAFESLVRNRTKLEEEGNLIDAAASQQRALSDAQIVQFVQKIANRKGPVSDALREAARQFREDGSPAGLNRAVSDFDAAVREALEDGKFAADIADDITGVIDEGDPAGRGTRPERSNVSIGPETRTSAPVREAGQSGGGLDTDQLAVFDEPTTGGRQAQIESLETELSQPVRVGDGVDQEPPAKLFSHLDDGDEIPVERLDGEIGAAKMRVADLRQELEDDMEFLDQIDLCKS